MNTPTLLITILISIVCGLLANLVTPSVRILFAKGISAYRRAKLEEIRSGLDSRIKWLKDQNDFFLFLFKEMFYVLTLSIFGITLLLLSNVDPSHVLSKLAMALSFSILSNALARGYANVLVVQSVRRFSEFEKRTHEKIAKLEAKVGKGYATQA